MVIIKESITLTKRDDKFDMTTLTEAEISDIVFMALSDHASFSDIKRLYGLEESQVKKVMKKSIKPKSYVRWRKRVKTFSKRREHYK